MKKTHLQSYVKHLTSMSKFAKVYSWPRFKLWMPSISAEGCASGLFIRNMMKDLHIQSVTVYFNELRITQLLFWGCIYVCPLWTEKRLQNKNISNFFPQVWPEHKLCFFYIINCLGHEKNLWIFIFFNLSLQVPLLCKSPQLMPMILHMGTVLKLSTVFSRDNHISPSNPRQVRGPYLSFYDNVCNSKWHAKPS